MSSSRSLLSPKLIGGAAAGLVVILTTWWLVRTPSTTGDAGAGSNPAGSAPGLTDPSAGDGHTPTAALPSPNGSSGTRSGGSGATKSGLGTDAGAIVMGSHVGGAAPGNEIDRAARAIADGSRAAQNAAQGTPPTAPPTAPPSAPPTGPSAAPPTAPPSAPSTAPATPPAKAPSGGDKTSPSGTAPATTNTGSGAGPGTNGTPATPPAVGPTTSVELAQALQLQQSDPVKARLLATRALDGGTLARGERDRAYDLVNALGKTLFFNPNVNPNDPSMTVYAVQSGDSLQKIVRSQQLGCDYRLLQRLNGLTDPNKLRLNQRLRVPKGDFHAEVLKNEYRLNLYLGEGSDRVMVQSFRVGLGESNGTPLGLFKVRPNSKLVDPQWTHPRTGQHFAANDPMNPIGEHWIGLVGVEDRNRDFLGYGIHGTIEPDSIGKDRSLGCVRLAAEDVAIVYECLTEPDSTILIK
ncbi:MAG: L,D-transpeptidase family protein [Phycisphaerae bacterium]|nr:L,D-transpeptidase family protein [Phycisphaerae bacterium]